MNRRQKRKGGGCLGTLFLLLVLVSLAAAGVYAVKDQYGIDLLAGGKKTAKVQQAEITIAEEDLTGKYYYQQLPEEERQLYKEILQGLRDRTDLIYVNSTDANQVNALFQDVMLDCPELFWCDSGASSTAYSGGILDTGNYTELQPIYNCTAKEKEQKQAQIDAKVQECLAGVSAEASEYDKILYVYEYIVNTVNYDLDAPDSQNIYSVFGNQSSVCAGYSKAMQYLLERLGIFCTYVTGTAGDAGEAHAWNLVQCDEAYYYVDVTWGDPVYQQAEGEEVNQLENISYDYMCCSSQELFKTHTPDAGVVLPECTSMDYNYYVVNGMYYDSYDGQEALKAMNSDIAQQGASSVFKFATAELYETGKADIMGDQVHRAAQNLCQMYGISQVEYFYQDNPELNKITIYWQYE